jgi:hypothetical protein
LKKCKKENKSFKENIAKKKSRGLWPDDLKPKNPKFVRGVIYILQGWGKNLDSLFKMG